MKIATYVWLNIHSQIKRLTADRSNMTFIYFNRVANKPFQNLRRKIGYIKFASNYSHHSDSIPDNLIIYCYYDFSFSCNRLAINFVHQLLRVYYQTQVTLRFEVLTVVKMTMLLFWDMTPCGLVGDTDVSEKHTVSIFRAEDGDTASQPRTSSQVPLALSLGTTPWRRWL
jgi:hypothetical protein